MNETWKRGDGEGGRKQAEKADEERKIEKKKKGRKEGRKERKKEREKERCKAGMAFPFSSCGPFHTYFFINAERSTALEDHLLGVKVVAQTLHCQVIFCLFLFSISLSLSLCSFILSQFVSALCVGGWVFMLARHRKCMEQSNVLFGLKWGEGGGK